MKNSTVTDVFVVSIIVIITGLLVTGGLLLYRYYQRATAMAALAGLGYAHTVYSGSPAVTFTPQIQSYPITDPNNLKIEESITIPTEPNTPPMF